MKHWFLILVLLVGGESVQAQEGAPATPAPRPVPPSGPLLQNAPEFSNWETNFTYPEDSAKKDKAPANRETLPQQIITTKTGTIIHEVATSLGGKQTDKWYNGKLQYEKSATSGSWRVKTGSVTNGAYDDRTYVPFSATGFRDLDWISASTYVGTIPYGNRTCLVFSKVGADKVNLGDSSTQKKTLGTLQTVAYIDAETRLPISMRDGGSVRVYHFTTPPTEMQTYPADLATDLKKGRDAQTRLLQLAPRPY